MAKNRHHVRINNHASSRDSSKRKHRNDVIPRDACERCGELFIRQRYKRKICSYCLDQNTP